MFFELRESVVFLLQLGVAAGCGVVLWRGLLSRPPARRFARCGGCGHELNAVETGRCPECGAELLRVGIRRPTDRRRLRAWLAACLIAWTLLVAMGVRLGWDRLSGLAGALGASTTLVRKAWGEPLILEIYDPYGRSPEFGIDATLWRDDLTTPRGDLIHRDAFVAIGPGDAGPPDAETTLTIDNDGGVLESNGRVLWSGTQLPVAPVEDLLERAGLPADHPHFADGVANMRETLQTALDGGSLRRGPRRPEGTSASPVIYLAWNRHAAAINGRTLLVVAAYVGGLAFIWRTHRRRVRRLEATG